MFICVCVCLWENVCLSGQKQRQECALLLMMDLQISTSDTISEVPQLILLIRASQSMNQSRKKLTIHKVSYGMCKTHTVLQKYRFKAFPRLSVFVFLFALQRSYEVPFYFSFFYRSEWKQNFPNYLVKRVQYCWR